MKIFLDTANVTELREGVAMGLVDGCTTNPSLIAKEKRPFRPLVEEICSIVAPGDVSLEVVATDFDGMVKEGKELAQVAPNAVVKCPLTKDGLKAVKHLSSEGIRVNQTLCFSATQALLSAKAGATYISPFLGLPRLRFQDAGAGGVDPQPSPRRRRGQGGRARGDHAFLGPRDAHEASADRYRAEEVPGRLEQVRRQDLASPVGVRSCNTTWLAGRVDLRRAHVVLQDLTPALRSAPRRRPHLSMSHPVPPVSGCATVYLSE